MNRILVVCDNTMGLPGEVVDDGLALLYLLGHEQVHIEGICCTHGNASVDQTYGATQQLISELGQSMRIARGAEPGDTLPSEAARFIVECSHAQEPIHLLSLGATTDLAAAETLEPGCLARFSNIALMGGITHTLFVGGKIMNELNFSVDGKATCTVFSAARKGAHILLADAWHCLPLTFYTNAFSERLIDTGLRLSPMLSRLCLPWMERARVEWNTDGFVAWDVLPAVALVCPSLVELIPFSVSCNERLLSVGYLEEAQDPQLAAPISLVSIPNVHEMQEHIFQTWEQACKNLGGGMQ